MCKIQRAAKEDKTMGIIGGELGYQMLRRFSRSGAVLREDEEHARSDESNLERMFGAEVWTQLRGKTVIEFGCGMGDEAVRMAQHGAGKVIGIDIRESVLNVGRSTALREGVADRCVFTMATDELADVIVSLDAFEHFAEPQEMLRLMRRLVKPDGVALIAFGPTWYHPLGGHLFSIFPWSHLLFTEGALIRWRSDFKNDGATRFAEVEAGLNQLTIRRFEELIRQSDFRFIDFETVPIKKLKRFSNKLTREFFTSVVRCRLKPR